MQRISLPFVFLLVGCLQYGAGPAYAQQPSLGDVLYATIVEAGVDAALVQYDDLLARHADAYDFGEPQLNALGYRLLREGRTDAAIAVLERNAARFPASFNVYDSLGEAYLAAGRYDRAAPLYRKVLAMLPEADLAPNVRAFLQSNAEQHLYVAEHFDAPSDAALHYVAFFGGAPAGRWDREHLAAFKAAKEGRAVSYRGFNLYSSPVPQHVAATLDAAPRADVSTSFLGGVYRTWVADGTLADISDLWDEQGWHEAFPEPFRRMATYDGRQYFVPLAFQWNPVFYRADLFRELDLSPPETWDALLSLCGTIREKGYTPFTVSVQNWPPPVVRWFSILNLRLNGAAFHERVMRGDVPFTDARIRAVFAHWKQLFDHGCFADDSAENNYRKAVDDLVEGRALMYNLGEWLYESLPAGYDRLDFFAMPVLDPGVPRAEIVHVYGAFMRSGTAHPGEARALLAHLGGAASQQSNAEALHRLNSNARVDPARYTDLQRRAFAYLRDEVDAVVPLLEFSMPPALAGAALEAFVRFWKNPGDVDGVLGQLEQARLEVRRGD